MPQSLMLETVKETVSGILSSGTKMHAATWIHSHPQSSYEILHEYIQRFSDLLIHATGTDSTAVTCHVTFVVFTTHLFNTQIEKKVARVKTIQPLTMTLAKKPKIKLKM